MRSRICRLLAHSMMLLVLCQCTPGIENPEEPNNSEQGGNTSSTFLDLTPSSLTLSYESQEKMVAILTNAPDGWHTDGSTVDWMSCTIKSDHIMVCVEANNGSDARQTEIVVTAADVRKSISVVQNSQSGSGFQVIEGEGFSCVLNDNTVMLPVEYARYIQNVDTNYQTFTVPAEIADKVSIIPGTNVVISTPTEMFPEGLLARIQEVKPNADGSYVVSYSTAHILDCFKDIDVSEVDIDLSNHVQKVLDKNGNELKFNTTKSITTETLHIEIPQVDIDLPMGCSITPKMEADITMKTQIKAENYRLSTMNVIMDADCTLGADISASLDLTSMSYQPQQKVCSIIFGAIPVGPLVITPTLDLYTIVKIDIKAKLEASVSYKRSFRAHVHYDEAEGLDMSTKLYDEEPNALKLEIGPKLESGITYGLGLGPGISLYGGALGVGISMNPCLSETVSMKFNIMDQKSYQSTRKGAALSFQSAMPTYDHAFELSAGASLYGIGFGYSATTPSIKFPLRSCPIAPQLADEMKAENDGSEVTLRTRVTGGQSLFYGPIVALLYNSNDPNNVQDYISCEFDFDMEKYDKLAETDEVEIVAKTPINPGKKYNVDLFTEIEGATLMLRSYYPEMRGLDKRFSAAVRAILRDIRSSAAGEWKGCNWDDAYVMVGDYENVELNMSYPSGLPDIKITIPEEWKLTGDLKIGNHTDGLEDLMAYWELDIDGDDRCFSKVEIDDPLIKNLYISDHVDSFSMRSELAPLWFSSWPKDVKEVNLSHCMALQKDLTVYMDDFPNLKKLVFDFCPVTRLKINGSETKTYKMPYVETINTDLEYFYVTYLDITGIDFTKIENAKQLTINNCKGNCNAHFNAESLRVGGLFESTVISACPKMTKLEVWFVNSPSVVISDNSNLSDIDIYMRASESTKYKIDALSITNCPVVKKIACWDTGISSLELVNLPSLTDLSCGSNRNLTGIMLPIFDEILAKKGNLNYDQRYTNYRWDYGKNGYIADDKGYGFYYQGEPDRGYHRR